MLQIGYRINPDPEILNITSSFLKKEIRQERKTKLLDHIAVSKVWHFDQHSTPIYAQLLNKEKLSMVPPSSYNLSMVPLVFSIINGILVLLSVLQP